MIGGVAGRGHGGNTSFEARQLVLFGAAAIVLLVFGFTLVL